MESLLTPLLVSAFAGFSTVIGFALAVHAEKWVKKYSYGILSLAAGVMLGTSFFHILPETHAVLGEGTFFWVLMGFVIFFLIESVIGFHACQEDEGHHHEHHHILGRVAGIGIFLHSLLDGVAIAVGYSIDPLLGLVTAVAVMVHELPEGIFTFSILLHNKMKLKKAAYWTAAVATATPLGTVLALPFLPSLSGEVQGVMLAIAAGSFIYIAASDLIPESHKSHSVVISLFLLVGLAGTYAFEVLVPHAHGGYDHDHEEHELYEIEESHDDHDHDDHDGHDH